MEIPDITSEKSIMEDVAYIEKTNNHITVLNNQLIEIKQELELARDLREHLQESLSSHIGDNEIDIAAFDKPNQIRIERWLVDW